MSRLIVLLSTLTIIFPTLLVWAVAGSQDTTNKIKNRGGESAEGPLKEAERDIAVNKFRESESFLNAYLKDHPDSSKAHYDLGYIQFRTHNVGASIKELSRSLELNPSNAEAHKILGLDCSIIGRDDLAETELVEATRLKPESGEIHYFLARTYYTRGVYPLAKSEFQTAIRLDPFFVKAYSNLGITMEALGDKAEALRNYTKAIQLEEQHKHRSEWPYIYLSSFYNRQNNADRALIFARKAIELNPRSFYVNARKNLFYCHGCGQGGDVIRFVELSRHLSFRETLSYLEQEQSAPPVNVVDSAAVLEEAVAFYQKQLDCYPEALRYLEQRGLHDVALRQELRIGYAPGACLRRHLTALGYPLDFLRRVGLLNPLGRDTFYARVVFPCCQGERIVNLYGRSLGDAFPHRFLPGPKGGLCLGPGPALP